MQNKEDSPKKAEQFNIGSDKEEGGQDGDDDDDDLFGDNGLAGLLYRQKIAELEELKVGLQRDLEILQSSRQLLNDDCRQKEELAANLLRQLRPDERPDDNDVEVPIAPKRNVLSQLLGRGRKEAQANRENREELERVAEEAMLDNVRLRKDLRGLAEEFRKLFGDSQGCRPDPCSSSKVKR